MPIIGSRAIAQLEDGVAALPVRLTGTELATLESAGQSGLPAYRTSEKPARTVSLFWS